MWSRPCTSRPSGTPTTSSARPGGCRRSSRRPATRTPSSPAPGSMIPRWQRCSRATPPSRRYAASGTSRARRPHPTRWRSAHPGRWATRRGAAATPCSNSTACRSTCRLPGGTCAEAAQLARDFRRTQIILNHAGLPADRSARGLAGWRAAMQTLAAEPNVAVKISGLGQPGQPWTVAANGPIVRDIIAIFGVDRCMFASNFPVDSLCADFDTIFAGFKTIVADMTRAAAIEPVPRQCASVLPP